MPWLEVKFCLPFDYLLWIYRIGVIGQYIFLYIHRKRIWANYNVNTYDIINYFNDEVPNYSLHRVEDILTAQHRQTNMILYLQKLGYLKDIANIIALYERDHNTIILTRCNKCNRDKKGRTILQQPFR